MDWLRRKGKSLGEWLKRRPTLPPQETPTRSVEPLTQPRHIVLQMALQARHDVHYAFENWQTRKGGLRRLIRKEILKALENPRQYFQKKHFADAPGIPVLVNHPVRGLTLKRVDALEQIQEVGHEKLAYELVGICALHRRLAASAAPLILGFRKLHQPDLIGSIIQSVQMKNGRTPSHAQVAAGVLHTVYTVASDSENPAQRLALQALLDWHAVNLPDQREALGWKRDSKLPVTAQDIEERKMPPSLKDNVMRRIDDHRRAMG